jgi:hypothetical protein
MMRTAAIHCPQLPGNRKAISKDSLRSNNRALNGSRRKPNGAAIGKPSHPVRAITFARHGGAAGPTSNASSVSFAVCRDAHGVAGTRSGSEFRRTWPADVMIFLNLCQLGLRVVLSAFPAGRLPCAPYVSAARRPGEVPGLRLVQARPPGLLLAPTPRAPRPR